MQDWACTEYVIMGHVSLFLKKTLRVPLFLSIWMSGTATVDIIIMPRVTVGLSNFNVTSI